MTPTVHLGDVATIERTGVDPSDLPPGTRYLGLEHIERGGRIIGYETVGTAELASTKFRFSPDHVLFGKLRPNLGKIARPEFDGVSSTDILPIRPGPRLDRDYLTHYLRQPSVVQYAVTRTTGANLPRLSPTALAAFEIPLPSIEQQRRIAAILDQADAIRTKRRQVLTHLDFLAQATFRSMFSESPTRVRFLADVADVSSGITKGRRTDHATRAVPYLAVSNVQAGYLKLDVVKEIEATAVEVDRYALRDGDLVLTEGGDPDKLGRGTVWRSELPLALHQNHIFRVRVNTGEVLSDYLAGYMASRKAREYFRRSAKQTTGIASINMTQLKALPVAVPAKATQERYVASIRAIKAQSAIVERASTMDDELFAGLQFRAFRGEL